MASDTVQLNWNPEEQFVLSDKENFKIKMKRPGGVKPSDMLAMALIGCSSVDVVEILQKQRQDLHELKVTAESVQDDDPPWRFRKINIHFKAIGKGIDPEKLAKAIKISEEKYCSVYATLKDAIEITNDYEVVEP
jgi:putative redox protein